MTRQSWDETWMATAQVVAQRSACIRRKAGCVIVDPTNRILSTGYNGPPANFKTPEHLSADSCGSYCDRAINVGNPLSYDNCVALHAEANCLAHTDPYKAVGGVAYITSCPCLSCAKLLAGAKIRAAVFSLLEVDIDRHPENTILFLKNCGIEVNVWQAIDHFDNLLKSLGMSTYA